jgi:hypothetical protein
VRLQPARSHETPAASAFIRVQTVKLPLDRLQSCLLMELQSSLGYLISSVAISIHGSHTFCTANYFVGACALSVMVVSCS